MTAPPYVHNYLDAQAWIFLHWGLPLIGLIIVIATGKYILETWYEDHESDDSKDFKGLGLNKDDK
jgi:hypothetical protein